jgi:hypothetical protein
MRIVVGSPELSVCLSVVNDGFVLWVERYCPTGLAGGVGQVSDGCRAVAGVYDGGIGDITWPRAPAWAIL